jgi:sn-glycerol 3-phosphate transport system ATP-binding protein
MGLVAALPTGAATIGVRAEDLVLGSDGAAATVETVEALGWESLVHLRAGALELCARVIGDRAPARGDTVRVSIADGGLHVFSTDGARLP